MQSIVLLNDGGPSDYAKDVVDFDRLKSLKSHQPELSDLDCLLWLFTHPRIEGESGTMSGYTQTHAMDHSNGKTAWTMPAVVALALCTAIPDSTKTGATITEATYTGYGRITVSAATFNAATAGAAGAAATTATNATLTGGACTAGSSVITGWALCDSATTAAGNMLWWGSTAASTTISTTQTPPTIASGGLTESLL